MIISINILSIIAGILASLISIAFYNEEISNGEDVRVFVIIIVIIAIIAVQIFSLPIRIAAKQDHPNVLPITVLTIAGGWTGILWVAALVWSLYAPQVEIKIKTIIKE